MKILFALLMLFLPSKVLAQTTSSKPFPISEETLQRVNNGIKKLHYRIDSVDIQTQYVNGNARNVSGKFKVSCPDKTQRGTSMIFIEKPLEDSVATRMRESGSAPLSLNESRIALTESFLLQVEILQSVSYIITRTVCSLPIRSGVPLEWYIGLSLWKKDGDDHHLIAQPLTSSQFRSLK